MQNSDLQTYFFQRGRNQQHQAGLSDLYSNIPHDALLVREQSAKLLNNTKLRINTVRARPKRQRAENAHSTEPKFGIPLLF